MSGTQITGGTPRLRTSAPNGYIDVDQTAIDNNLQQQPGQQQRRECRFSALMAHAAILTDGFPVFLIRVASACFSFPWQIRQLHGCAVVEP